MKVKINGIPKEIKSKETLQDIIQQFCKETKHVIAELNGEIVKFPRWNQTILQEGDAVELVKFVGGG